MAKNKIEQLGELAKAIDKEKDIDKAIDSFMTGAGLVKEILAELEVKSGKVYEVIKDVDKYIEELADVE